MKANIVQWCMVKNKGCQMTKLSKFLCISPCLPHILTSTVYELHKLLYSIQNEAVHAPQITTKELTIILHWNINLHHKKRYTRVIRKLELRMPRDEPDRALIPCINSACCFELFFFLEYFFFKCKRFLDASSNLFKSVCLSVCPFVCPYVC